MSDEVFEYPAFSLADTEWTRCSFTARGAIFYSSEWPKSLDHKNPYPMFGLRVASALLIIDLGVRHDSPSP